MRPGNVQYNVWYLFYILIIHKIEAKLIALLLSMRIKKNYAVSYWSGSQTKFQDAVDLAVLYIWQITNEHSEICGL